MSQPSKPSADEALEALVKRYAGLVRAAAARVARGRGPGIEEDVEQTVFLSIWRQLSREQTITSPASYLYKCAVRETVRLLRARDRVPTTSLTDAGVDPPEPAGQATSAVSAAVDGALTTLSEERRRAVRAHLEGFAVTEIMDMYGWTYQRARNLIARGMNDLRLVLRERGIHE